MTATRPEQDWFAKADEDLEMARRKEEARFTGRHRTRVMIASYMNEIAVRSFTRLVGL